MNDAPRPVSREENEAANGSALCARQLWDNHIATVEHLRQRQADYRASLPTSHEAAILQAVKLLSPSWEDCPPCLERASNMAVLLEIILRGESENDLEYGREALSWAAERVAEDLSEMRDVLSRALDVLRNPDELACKARGASG
jgi:hypothetical protein